MTFRRRTQGRSLQGVRYAAHLKIPGARDSNQHSTLSGSTAGVLVPAHLKRLAKEAPCGAAYHGIRMPKTAPTAPSPAPTAPTPAVSTLKPCFITTNIDDSNSVRCSSRAPGSLPGGAGSRRSSRDGSTDVPRHGAMVCQAISITRSPSTGSDSAATSLTNKP
jgi:hypothetical protein